MIQNSNLSDKIAMFLSSACIIHCAFLPILVMILPSTLATVVEDESFHIFMLALAIPISSFTLFMGYKQHQQKQFLIFGGIGMLCLVLGATVVSQIWGETGETVVTIIGSAFIFYGHFLNIKQGNAAHCGSCRSSAQSPLH